MQQFQLGEDIQDKVFWKFHNLRCFTVKGFQEECYKRVDQMQQHNSEINKVWRKVAPLKAELFLWLVLQGRINTKVRLYSLNLLSNSDTRCVFCNQEDEDLSHLLFNCIYVWRFWCRCCNIWGMNWVMSNDSNTNFDCWLSIAFRGETRKKWILCFYVITWSVRKLRNDIIFNATNATWEQFFVEMGQRYQFWMELWYLDH